jgi:hypothetical protein
VRYLKAFLLCLVYVQSRPHRRVAGHLTDMVLEYEGTVETLTITRNSLHTVVGVATINEPTFE